MDKKRIGTKRVPFTHTVYYGTDSPPKYLSFVTDLSEDGIHIKTNAVFSIGTKLHLLISLEDKRYKAEGVVVWAKEWSSGLVPPAKSGMGLKFERIDSALMDICCKQLGNLRQSNLRRVPTYL